MRTTFRFSAVSIIAAIAALGAGRAVLPGIGEDGAGPASVEAARTGDDQAPVGPPEAPPAPPPPPAPGPLHPRPPADGRDAPDPFVLRADDLWVLFSTQVGLHNVPVTVSVDMATWYPPADALPVLPTWATWGRTWAPGVVALPDHYVLYFAARSAQHGRQCIGAAISDRPYGPFTPTSDQPLICQLDQGGSIDPDPFVDTAGSPYLLWKADGNAVGIASRLYSQRLRPDGLALEGEPVELLRSGSAWEQPLIENPAMTVLGGQHVLLYSGGWWESNGYATGYATCAGPLGPCTKVTVDGPIHRGDGDEAGPGGAAVLTGPTGDQWVVYHAWTAGRVGYDNGGARSVRFAPLGWSTAGVAIG